LTARYLHLTKLLRELSLGQGDGRYPKLMKELAHTDLIALDDFGLEPLQNQQQRILLELMEDRYALRSTLMTSQYPIEHWHERIGNPTLADAILDRIVHNAYKLNLQGESLRKPKRPLTTTEDQT
jgi:DNA replication protein DnaC